MGIAVDFAVLAVKARIAEESEEEKTPQAGLIFASPSRQKSGLPPLLLWGLKRGAS